ncbi:MAG: hypothetical protein QXT19_01210 [Candidatus Woesearchaeota archaeon]
METAIKAIAVAVIAVLVVSLALVALGRLSGKLFWIIAIATAIIAYYGIPAMRRKAIQKE